MTHNQIITLHEIETETKAPRTNVFLIDPFAETVRELTVTPDSKGTFLWLQKLLGCEIVQRAHKFGNGDSIYTDAEALLKLDADDMPKGFMVWGNLKVHIGYGIMTGRFYNGSWKDPETYIRTFNDLLQYPVATKTRNDILRTTGVFYAM